jgi:hypothetical protein
MFGTQLEISIELEQIGVVHPLIVGGENGAKRRQDSLFPIDECAVAVEGEDFETVEVEHRE